MLLRRVIEHVKAQNWTAVGIDFVIVVVGVFIGFQLTAWNEDRGADVERDAAIERLHIEAERAVVYFQRRVEFLDESNRARTEALALLVAGDFEGANRDRISQGLSTVSVIPSAAPPRSAYDEIISTGLFTDIGDVELREAITSYYSTLTFLDGQIDYFRSVSDTWWVWGFAEMKATFDPEADSQMEVEYDFLALSQNTDFMKRVLIGNNAQRSLADFWGGALEDAQTMCRELARVSNRACAPLEEAS